MISGVLLGSIVGMTNSNVPVHAEATLTNTATEDVASWVPDTALRVALQAALGKGCR